MLKQDKKCSKLTRLYKDDWHKLNTISNKLTEIQNNKIAIGEVIRRAFNIPRLNDILVQDAKMKAINGGRKS